MENEERFYLDTSIWLDFFENRNEPNFSKGTLAKELIKKIIKNPIMDTKNFLFLYNGIFFIIFFRD
jgi:hypothetical protein